MREDLTPFSRYWLSGEYVLLDPSGGSEPGRALIFDQVTWTYVLIENDSLARAIKEAMRDQGVPILKEPAGENVIEQATDAMLAAGVDIDEINERRWRLAQELRKRFRDGRARPGN